MVCFEEFVAVAPAEELPPMPAAGIVLEVDGCDFLKSSDASTRSGSPSASSATSEQCSTEDFKARNSCGGLTWEDLENELLSKLPIRKECTQDNQVLPAPSSPSRPHAAASAILGSYPKQRARPSTIALPSDASERTPMATPATSSWAFCGGIMGTPASGRPPLPRSDASQRPHNRASPQSELSFMASAMATSPSKRRYAFPATTGDASQRSPTRMSPADLGPRKSLLSTMGTNKTPATGDASRRSTPSSPAAEVKAWTATPTSSQRVSSPASSQGTLKTLSTTPTPVRARASPLNFDCSLKTSFEAMFFKFSLLLSGGWLERICPKIENYGAEVKVFSLALNQALQFQSWLQQPMQQRQQQLLKLLRKQLLQLLPRPQPQPRRQQRQQQWRLQLLGLPHVEEMHLRELRRL
eukprot:TRINITY_DN4650_c0_g1_i4.p1 TRINITY_DN4650_c0_g1~~TRINITY_DN4650_c0_g1_i4.p1  ORF type:complete len:412 (+),score=92.35 TRINITY_DN4650_c0_g1_i4:71-1306(+)